MKNSNDRIGIWGFGVVGQSILKFFATEVGIPISVMDKKQPNSQQQELLNTYNATFFDETQIKDFLKNHTEIYVSPGIDLRPYRRWYNNWYYAKKWRSELDLFSSIWDKPIIAITGSVGKTTVTHLLSKLLEQAEKKVATGGNIGTGMIDLFQLRDTADYALLEVSSFQLELATGFVPSLALWTNFHPNHLDRHGSLTSYFNAKYRILENQDTSDCALVPLELARDILARKPETKLIFFTTQPVARIPWDLKKYTIYACDAEHIIKLENNRIEPLIALSCIPDISFKANWIQIIGALDYLNINPATLDLSVDFALPAHRLEEVATVGRARFYNDSKSTIPASTLAALEQLKTNNRIILFVGGVSKGLDRSEFIKQLAHKVAVLYCFGAEAGKLAEYARASAIDCFAFEKLDDAVDHCMRTIQEHDTVLFSPAGASFDAFANYGERGQTFKKLVQNYIR